MNNDISLRRLVLDNEDIAVAINEGRSNLVSEQTYLHIKDRFTWNRKYRGRVKGKEQPVVVYEPEIN